jgi:hypothetical protein
MNETVQVPDMSALGAVQEWWRQRGAKVRVDCRSTLKSGLGLGRSLIPGLDSSSP